MAKKILKKQTRIDTMEESLTLVKQNGYNLAGVHIQNIEICKAAVLTDEDTGVLKFVDPELRTTALLESIGIDTNDFDDSSFTYINSENYEGNTSEYYTFVEIYGKCNPDLLEITQKHLRRSLESSKDTWEDVWQGNPLDAKLYSMEISLEKTYFKMSFEFIDEFFSLEKLSNIILDNFYDESLIDTVYTERYESRRELYLFLFAVNSQEYSNNCEYFIVKPIIDDDYIVEHKKWEHSTSDYKDYGTGPNDARLDWIKKRLALWLAEGTNDKTLLSQLKNDLLKVEKIANDVDKNQHS